jgi:hypothetical protein
MTSQGRPAPWPAGASTGVGSLPGTNPHDAIKLVFDELPDLPHLPELPARGPGADMLPRTAVIALDMPVDLQPSGWRLVPRAGLESRRARSMLEQDLDALEEVAAGYLGPLKIALAGPWTLAAGLELPRGHKALSDSGATRDLAEALAAGLTDLLADLGRRVPGARLLVQLDEPLLPAVLAGRVRTPSGFSVVRAVEAGPAAERLALVFAAAGAPGDAGRTVGVHCCAPDVPIELLRRAGADFVGLDATLLTPAADDAIGEAVEAGLRFMAGLVPATDAPVVRPDAAGAPGVPTGPDAAGGRPDRRGAESERDAAREATRDDDREARREAAWAARHERGAGAGPAGPGDARLSDPGRTVEPVRALWRRLGFRPEQLGEVVAVTPTCGLAGASEGYALAAMRRCRKAAGVLVESPE